MTTIELEKVSTSSNAIDGQQFYTVVADLCEAATLYTERVEYFAKCFEIITKHIDVGVGVLNVRMGARTLERTYFKTQSTNSPWTKILDPLVLRVQTDADSLLQEFRQPNQQLAAYALATPVFSNNGNPIGAVAFVLPGISLELAKANLAQIDQLLELVVENAPDGTTKQPADSDDSSKTAQSVVKASDYRSIEHLCFAIANSLCAKLSCEQVAIGVIRNRDVKLVAVSGLSEIPRSTPGITALVQSMGVGYDRNETTVVQEPGRLVDQCESSPCKVHGLWRRITNGASVATIPLQVGTECVAVISIRRQKNLPFVPDDIRRAKILGESFAPALPLVDRANRSVLRHLSESLSASLRYLCSSQGTGRAIALCIFIASMFWMAFGQMEYSIMAPAKIVPEQVNTVSAPFDGMIEKVHILPGEKVAKGMLLLSFDKRELLIEKKKILSEIAATQIEANAKLQERKADESFLLQAQLQVLQTDLQLVNEKLARSKIHAKHDGIVLPTEVHQRVGQYLKLGEPLLEIANENQWHLEIETPEDESRHLAIHQTGYFQSNARPDQKHTCRLAKISPSSQVLNQKNVVVAESVLENREQWMKIGMEGNVRIQSGYKPVWWVYTHRVVDYVRLKLWL